MTTSNWGHTTLVSLWLIHSFCEFSCRLPITIYIQFSAVQPSPLSHSNHQRHQYVYTISWKVIMRWRRCVLPATSQRHTIFIEYLYNITTQACIYKLNFPERNSAKITDKKAICYPPHLKLFRSVTLLMVHPSYHNQYVIFYLPSLISSTIIKVPICGLWISQNCSARSLIYSIPLNAMRLCTVAPRVSN